MGIEIERKFLVNGEDYKKGGVGRFYRQAYLAREAGSMVRIRTCDDKGFITVKGKTSGITRLEYEYEIPYTDAQEMIDHLCEPPVIEKYRYHVEYAGFIWEVDEFCGDNQDLVVAEIELPGEGTAFSKPDWIGREVSHDPRYRNSNLTILPYKSWRKDI